jgi:uncharacterized protein (TIGR02271 family)
MYNSTSQWSGDQIPLGATVYDAAGDKVGTVAEYDLQAGYLLVEKGWLFHKDIYVPTSAISRIDENGVYLQLYKDDLQGDRYASPPTAGIGTNAADTMVDDVPVAGGTFDTTNRVASGTYDTTNRVATGTDQADIRVPVREEELAVGKQQQETGRVHLHKDVVEEPRTVDVSLQQERVTVERVPYSGDATATDDAFQERDIDVPVMGEQAVVGKRVQGVEEVRVRKDVVTDTEQVSDTVRKERVMVDGAPDQDSTRGNVNR